MRSTVICELSSWSSQHLHVFASCVDSTHSPRKCFRETKAGDFSDVLCEKCCEYFSSAVPWLSVAVQQQCEDGHVSLCMCHHMKEVHVPSLKQIDGDAGGDRATPHEAEKEGKHGCSSIFMDPDARDLVADRRRQLSPQSRLRTRRTKVGSRDYISYTSTLAFDQSLCNIRWTSSKRSILAYSSSRLCQDERRRRPAVAVRLR